MKFRRSVIAIVFILLITLPLAGCNNASNQNKQTPATKGNQPISGSKTPSTAETQEQQRREKAANLLQEIEKLAREGKVPGCKYAVKTSVIDNVENDWGKPDKNEYIASAKGTFATYNSRGIVFGSNKGMQIFDIRSYDPALKKIRPSDLVRVYGPAAATRSYDGQQMIGYVVSEDFRVRFIFPASTKEVPDPGLDHLSILYPAGSVNSMADDPGIEW